MDYAVYSARGIKATFNKLDNGNVLVLTSDTSKSWWMPWHERNDVRIAYHKSEAYRIELEADLSYAQRIRKSAFDNYRQAQKQLGNANNLVAVATEKLDNF